MCSGLWDPAQQAREHKEMPDFWDKFIVALADKKMDVSID